MDSSHQNKYPNDNTDNEAAVGEASRTASSPAVENSDSAMEKFRTGDYLPLNVSEEPKDRSSGTGGLNRKALLTFMVIVVVAVAIISLTVIFVVYSGSGKDADSKKQRRSERRYQFDDMLNWTFNPIIPRSEKWISDDSVITVDERAIIIHNASTDKITELFSDEQLKALRINTLTYFSLSPDGAWMLFAVDKKKKYRYSSVARYLAVDVKTRKQVTNISTSGSSTQSLIQYISWGSRNSIVFVSGSDIYWIKSIEKPDPIKVTSSGSEKIFNGIPDWVYEEEILGQRPAVVISPDEKHLSYATFNDTEVRPFEISLYGDPNAAYTRVQDIAYPKPGFSNPYVQIYIYSVDQKKEIELKPPSDISESDFYFTNLVWASKTIVSVTWMNRAQNVSIVTLCSVHKGFCIKNYQLVVPDGWLNQDYPDPFFSSDGGYYLQLLPKTEGENGEFLHVAKVASIKNANNEIKFLTAGQWEVKKIISLDEKNGVVYYESSETSPTQSHLYSVNLDGKNKRCLSCELNETKDNRCQSYSSSFSTDSSWYILTCNGPAVPISWFRSTKDDTAFVYENNWRLQITLNETTLPQFEYYTVKTTDGAYDIHVRELRPPDFSEDKKYAVLFHVYGGPDSQQVLETFQTDYHTYLTSNFDIIVCEVDGRGTASRGRRFAFAVYDQLGEYERNDTLAVARFMQSRKYVDPDRIAVWGWSYGGFLTSFILSTQEERIFRSGVAVAPVTDWRYYDSVYTERYMGQPSESDNFLGYRYSSVLTHAANIPDDSFLLIHGTGDDNVHFQNTAQLVRVLTEAGVRFEMQIYTDKHHALEGYDIQRHLYHLMTDFHKARLNL